MGNLQGPEEGGRNSLSTIIFNHLVVYIGNQSPTTRARRRLPCPTTTSHHHSNRFPFPLEIFRRYFCIIPRGSRCASQCIDCREKGGNRSLFIREMKTLFCQHKKNCIHLRKNATENAQSTAIGQLTFFSEHYILALGIILCSMYQLLYRI